MNNIKKTEKFKQSFDRKNSQQYYLYDDQKEEALLKLWKESKNYALSKQNESKELNYLLVKFYSWKNSFFEPIRAGSVGGSIFVLLCVSFGSSIK